MRITARVRTPAQRLACIGKSLSLYFNQEFSRDRHLGIAGLRCSASAPFSVRHA